MSTRFITGAIGGVIGFVIGGPMGAAYGWTIGSTIGGIADPGTIKGPSIGDIANQTSQEGGPRPIVFAMSPPMAGNVIASGPPVKHKKKKRQGKGGPKVEYETVTRTYAIGICEGPVEQIVRVWRNGELVYNAQDADELNVHDARGIIATVVQAVARMQSNNAKFLEKARFYVGTYDQDPDPALEELFGAGTTPAHRGTVYMVMENDDLTDFRGAIPQYVFQVTKKPTFEPLQIYTPGVYTWEKPEFLESATVTVIGGGGGGSSGGGGPNVQGMGSGGAGAGFARATYDADDLPDTMTVTVGAGGAGGPTNYAFVGGNGGDFGQDGGDSSFGSFMSAEGGGGGIPYSGSGGSASIAGTGSVAGGNGATDIVTATGGISYKETLNPPTGSTYGGGGGGSGDVSGNDPYTPGGVVTNPNGYAIVGGDGGQSGEGVQDGNAVAGATGENYGGGGGAGGAAGVSHIFNDGIYASGVGGDGGPGVVALEYEFSAFSVSLQEVVAAICERAGLPADKIDVSMLEGRVRGFTITNAYPALEALRSLSQVFMFDPSPIDGRVVFVPRGLNTVATITEDDMLEEEQDIDQTRRGDAIAIPRVMNLNYYDVAGNLNTDKQTSERAGDRRAMGEIQLQSPVVMNADEAKRAVTINHKVYIEDQRGELNFKLPDKWLRLVPAAPVFVQWEGRTDRARIMKIDTQDGYQELVLVRDRQSAYTSNVEGYPAAPAQVPASNVVGPTLIEPLDLAPLYDVDDGLGMFYYFAVSGTTDAWQGATVEISYDGGANYQDSRDALVPVTMGVLETPLADHPADVPDVTHTCQVRIQTPDAELTETDLAGLLGQLNRAVIGDEVLQFAGADELEPGLWELSYFLRGRRGTSSSYHAAGERFVLLDSVTAIPASITDIGRTLTFRAVSFGADVSTATVASMVYVGYSQTEFAVGYLEARRVGDSPASIEVNWQGRGRLGAGANVAHGARFAGYRVTFTDSDSPPATVSVDTMAQTLTQNVAALVGPITVAVVQLNDLTGEGPETSVVVT